MSDTISRQAAIEIVDRYDKSHMILKGKPMLGAASIVIELEDLPSAQPEQRTGKWMMVPDPYGFFDEIPVCSECGCTTKMRKTYKYCPNCGAKLLSMVL